MEKNYFLYLLGGIAEAISPFYIANNRQHWDIPLQFPFDWRIKVEFHVWDLNGWNWENYPEDLIGIPSVQLGTMTLHELTEENFNLIEEELEEE